MAASNYNFDMYQGSTFELNLTLKDSTGNTRNLTSYTSRMQIRSSYASSTIAESLTTETGEIEITGANGFMHIEIPASRTAGIKVDLGGKKPPKSVYVYDMELIDSSGKVDKIMYGDITVIGEVTR